MNDFFYLNGHGDLYKNERGDCHLILLTQSQFRHYNLSTFASLMQSFKNLGQTVE